MRKLVVMLGVPIDNLTIPEAVDRIEDLVRIGRATGKVHQVVTVNADFVVQALFDPELRYLLQHADLSTADGMPLVWGARWLGTPLQERVAGADLVPALVERAAQKGLSVYFLGAGPGVAARAARILKERNPNLCIVGIQSPPYSSVLEMDISILEDIQAASPDILLVAFGNPKQEKWIGMYGHRLGIPVMIGVGGSLDFIAGQTRRAPEWMQRTGLEWLFRLLQEPRRLLKRYVVDLAVFGLYFMRQWWMMRRNETPVPHQLVVDLDILEHTSILRLRGRVTAECRDSIYEMERQALKASQSILVDLRDVTSLDSSAIGSLVELAHQARGAGGELSLAAVPPSVYNTLALLKLNHFFPIFRDVISYLVEEVAKGPDQASLFQNSAELLSRPDGKVWAVLKGPRAFDAVTAPRILEEGSSILAKNPLLILDLSETVFLASAGLAAMAQLRKLALQNGGEFRVVHCSEDVLKVIKMVRFDRVLSLFSDLSLAVS